MIKSRKSRRNKVNQPPISSKTSECNNTSQDSTKPKMKLKMVKTLSREMKKKLKPINSCHPMIMSQEEYNLSNML
tara:strand:+ start:574 stop:798 length:225 start_codon:yes stop_codon:yes gene_type:complete